MNGESTLTSRLRLQPRVDQTRTIDFIFKWLLRWTAAGAVLSVFMQLGVYIAVSRGIFIDPSGEPIHVYMGYLVVAVVCAVFDVSVWFLWKDRPYRQLYGAILVLGNAAVLIASGALMFHVYPGVHMSLLMPAILIMSVFAAILTEFRWTLLVVTIMAAAWAGLMFYASGQELLARADLIPTLNILLFLFLIAVPVGFISGQQRRAAAALAAMNRQLEEAQAMLSRYVAPQVAKKVLSGDELGTHHRRKLTLFFSDVKDFTTLTDALEPEDMAELLNEYIEEMVKIAGLHTGTVAQISGDGLFIFFGAPEFLSDQEHALRAVRMAVQMQMRIRELQKKWFESGIEDPLQVRCGVNTGRVTVGGFGSEGRKEYTAIGMQTNLAARIEVACTPGQVLISHTTWALVKDEIPCLEADTITVKGFHKPIRTYQVDLDAARDLIPTLVVDETEETETLPVKTETAAS